jgi:hypothetical protein
MKIPWPQADTVSDASRCGTDLYYLGSSDGMGIVSKELAGKRTTGQMILVRILGRLSLPARERD